MLQVSHLDEGTSQEEAVCKANLHTAEQRRDTSPVDWQVGEEVSDDGSRGHWGLQHTDERITVDGLDDLLLHVHEDMRKVQSQYIA